MGAVFEARDLHRGERVALKVLIDRDAESVARFKNEFRALTNIAHANLVGLFELLNDRDRWFFTMELVDGENLVRRLCGAPLREEGSSSPSLSRSGQETTATITTRGVRLAGGAVVSESERGPAPNERPLSRGNRLPRRPPRVQATHRGPRLPSCEGSAPSRHQAEQRPGDGVGPGRHPRFWHRDGRYEAARRDRRHPEVHAARGGARGGPALSRRRLLLGGHDALSGPDRPPALRGPGRRVARREAVQGTGARSGGGVCDPSGPGLALRCPAPARSPRAAERC